MKTNYWFNRNRFLSDLRIATAGTIALIENNVSVRDLVNRSPLRRGLLLISLVLACFAISPMAQAKQPTPTPTPPGEDRGNGNTAAENVQALNSNTTGINNTATGWQSLFSNTAGNDNTANGFQSLLSNTTGFSNTANGLQALFSNTTGYDNTASGFQSLLSNTTGDNNTATGLQALVSSTTGSFNTATGTNALVSNTTGSRHTASGFQSLYSNTTGNNNTATGDSALYSNTTGTGNIGLGANAGELLTTGDNNIDIGNQGVAAETNTIRIGTTGTHMKTFIAGIDQPLVTGGTTVQINSAGQLGVVISSRRFKKEIKPMDQASEAILALKPVTFHYKSDSKGTPQFGLIAEEVAEVNPNLVVRDGEGEIYTVRYEAVNAMLLNEFLKEHRKVEEQQATIAQLKKGMELLAVHTKEQDLKIEKVSARLAAASPSRGGLEARNPAPQMALNNQ
jgi:hypothetical protein